MPAIKVYWLLYTFSIMRGDISAAQRVPRRKTNSQHHFFKVRICLPHMVHNWEFFPFKGNCSKLCVSFIPHWGLEWFLKSSEWRVLRCSFALEMSGECLYPKPWKSPKLQQQRGKEMRNSRVFQELRAGGRRVKRKFVSSSCELWEINGGWIKMLMS